MLRFTGVLTRCLFLAGLLWPCRARAAEPPVEWVEPQTGHRIVRLSRLPGSVSLYFHQNAFTPEGDKLLMTTPEGLSTVDLKTREIQVVVPRGQFQGGGSSEIEMGRRSRQVYFMQRTPTGSVIRATHIDTLESHEIVKLPRGASFNGVNADESAVFGTMNLTPRGDAGPDSSSRRMRTASPGSPRSMQFWHASISGGEIQTFHPSTDWLNHGQCSPTDPTRVLFCHEGIWQDVDRVWTIALGENDARLLHKRQGPHEIAGHEFFSRDGQWVWYDLQTPRSAEFWLAGVHLNSGERIQYRLKRAEWSVHYNISPDGRLFAGDGGGPNSVANQTPLPEKRRLTPSGNGPWIYLFRPQSKFEPATISGEPGRSGELAAERLVDLAMHDYSLEPNVNFTPDGQWIVFRSNMHGERHVYMVAVEKE